MDAEEATASKLLREMNGKSMVNSRVRAGSSWLLGSLAQEALACRLLVWAPLADMRTGKGQPQHRSSEMKLSPLAGV